MQHKTQANLEVSTSLKRKAVLDQVTAAPTEVLCPLPSREAQPTSTKPTASCWGQGNDLAWVLLSHYEVRGDTRKVTQLDNN